MSVSEGALFKPVFGMFALTGLVSMRMLFQRVTAVSERRVSPKEYKLIDISKLPGDQAVVVRLFSNLCETPALFYAVCLFITTLKKTDETFVKMANFYLLLRIIHAAIFLTFNRPDVRLVPFALSLTTMGAMYLRLYRQIA